MTSDTDRTDSEDPVRLGVDVGGTFTDVVLVVEGRVTTAKVPTTDDQSVGVLRGIETACEATGVEPAAVDRFRHAMTVSVNALLEGTGARTALVTTAGFGDVLEVGRQDRPSLYDLDARKPDPLVPASRRYELDERATVDGIERPVEADGIDRVVAELAAEGDAETDADAATDAESAVESVAVSLLHAYAHPENERRVAEELRDRLPCPVSVSHEVLGEFREYERTATTVADAYVTPPIDAYLGRLANRADERGLPAPRVMQANGGIADAATVREHAVTTLLSGPAAGVVGASLFERHAGDLSGVITFDMGGTSSDVGLVREGSIERTTEATVGGHPVGVPMVDVNTVGAGGGSIAWVDGGGALRVGPQSAGADPGPACYGKEGDEPTVTDANLLLGYLGADTTLGEDLSLVPDRAGTVLADLGSEADLAVAEGPADDGLATKEGVTNDPLTTEEGLAAARGVYRVANATMTRAIRGVTVERGHDPREFALAAFGGAGPMHATALADRLGIGTVIVPRAEGVLSALGLLAADEKHDAVRTARSSLATADAERIEAVYDELVDRVLAEASDPDAAITARSADCRYEGQSFELAVDVPAPFDAATVADRFHDRHERERGYRMDEPVDLVNLRATATVPSDPPTLAYEPGGDPETGRRRAFFGDGYRETPVLDRERLVPGEVYEGPAVVEGGESTAVVRPGWSGGVREDGTLVLEATDR